MDAAPKNLEWSLAVPCVQELQGLEKVPSRYVRDDDDEFNVNTTTAYSNADDDPALRVPLIDMTKLVNSKSRELEVQKLHFACKDWGLFQLINHGIPDEIVINMKTQAKEFFDLPLQEKRQCAQKSECLEGYGHAFITSEEQKLDWYDMLFLRVFPLQERKLEFWPKNPIRFRESLEKYIQAQREVATNLIQFMTMGLDIGAQELCKAYQEASCYVRMNYYPRCPEPERVNGLSPHIDINGITFLLDCGHAPGLQILKDGQWVFAEPLDGAIVVNLGQIMQIMSNGIYKAPTHRVVANKLTERLSIATFCYPSSIKIGPATELIEKGIRPKYKTVTLDEFIRNFLGQKKIDDPFIESLEI